MKSILQYKFRNENQQPSIWLPKDICTNALYVDSPYIHHIDSYCNLTNLIYENEAKKNIKYLSEGLIKTYPTAKFITMLKSRLNHVIPKDLQDLKLSDISSDDKNDTKLLDFVDKAKEFDGISSMFAILVPYVNNKDFKAELDKIVNDAFIYGYNLSSVEKLEHDLLKDIDVFVVLFEAKYSKDKFELANVLLHVAPLKLLNKIARQGLVPKSKSTEFKYKDRVYLFNQCPKDIVMKYAQYKMLLSNDDGFCVFKILKNNLVNDPKYKADKLNFFIDTAFSTDTSINAEAIFTYNNVEPKLLDNECVIFMKDDMNTPIVKKFK